MPKAERGTPKDLANRMKAKGLQKLKFYCQMCQKQCRDENGFKCHLTSDSHLRQMKIFSDNPNRVIDGMSKEFEMAYMETLRRRHGASRVNANNVYQEVIQDKHHIHMNATKWTTLTEFCQYLGKTSKCVVEETERGWYVTYIERDAAILERQAAQKRRAEADKREEERVQRTMEIQRVEAAKALDRAGGTVHTVATKLDRDAAKEISLSIGTRKKKAAVAAPVPKKSILMEEEDDDDEEEKESVKDEEKESSKGRKRSRWGTSTDDVATDERGNGKRLKNDVNPKSGSKKPKKKSDSERQENWLHRDILVRIISKKFGKGKYYKRKGVVDRVLDKFTAEVEILDSAPGERDGGDIVRLDQDDLETVIPKEGKSVRILNGRCRGKRAKLVAVDKKRYIGTLKVDDGITLEGVDFEDFSKIA